LSLTITKIGIWYCCWLWFDLWIKCIFVIIHYKENAVCDCDQHRRWIGKDGVLCIAS